MEMEIKLAIPSEELAARISEDPQIRQWEEPDYRETLPMRSVYFDTADRTLAAHQITFRVREEGESVIATLKWDGALQDGVFTRQEINVPASAEDGLIVPRPELFSESEEGKVLLALLQGKPLLNLLEIHFLRRRTRVEVAGSEMEVSVDTGKIITDAGEEPVCEVEVELFAGEIEQVKEIGKYLAETYGLVPESRSKYARGLALIENSRRKEIK